MIMNDNEILSRLNSPDNIVNKLFNSPVGESRVIIKPLRDKPKVQGNDLPPMIKELIAGVVVESSESQASIAKTFGVSHSLVNQTARGLVGARVDESLKEAAKPVNTKEPTKEDKAHDLALDAMVDSLGLLNSKLAAVNKPTELARIARDMSTISNNIKQGRGDSDGEKKPVVQVILFAPQEQKHESEFNVIDV